MEINRGGDLGDGEVQGVVGQRDAIAPAVDDHHRLGAVFGERQIQQQVPAHLAGAEAPVEQPVGQLPGERRVVEHPVQVGGRALHLPLDHQVPARGVVHRRQVHGDAAQLTVEQAPTGDLAADFAAVDQHIGLDASGHRPVRQERQVHIAALEAHLEGAVLLPLRVDFDRPPVEKTALVQVPATERLGQPVAERIGQLFHGNVVRRPRRVAVMQVGEQAQLRYRQALAAFQPEHGDTAGVGVSGHQGAGLHRPATLIAEPAQHAVEPGTQRVIVKPGHGELQRVAVDTRHAVAGAAGHPAVQPAGAGHPVQGIGGEAGETGLDDIHPALHAGQIQLLQHAPGLMFA